jgi:hypothetical protein
MSSERTANATLCGTASAIERLAEPLDLSGLGLGLDRGALDLGAQTGGTPEMGDDGQCDDGQQTRNH